MSILDAFKGGLVVSCQASPGEPLCAPEHICALALSAVNGGASALRLEGAEDISYLRKRCKLPIVGLIKSPGIAEDKRLSSVYITGTFVEAAQCAEAGADIIALDATNRQRPDGKSLSDLIASIHKDLGKLVWADVSTYEEGLEAEVAGADVVSTTLSGYTEETFVPPATSGPDLTLLHRLCCTLKVPVVLEGRVWTPDEVKTAFDHGAYSVVVGSAITRPQLITERFVRVTPSKRATASK
jgi:N-acylglucosamine-6-phosphate 2-epimerase